MAKAQQKHPNQLIRKKARGLFRKHYGRMALFCALMSLLNQGANLLAQVFPGLEAWEPWFTTLWAVLVAPVTLVGMARVGLTVWRGGAPSLREMFGFTHPFSRLLKAWALGLLAQPMSLLPLITSPEIIRSSRAIWLLLGMMFAFIALYVLAVWVAFRLLLNGYMLADHPDLRVTQVVRASWRRMKGDCWRMFAHQTAMLWPVLLTVMAVVLLFPAKEYGAWPAAGATLAAWALWYGYVMIGLAGLADELMKKRIDETPKSEQM